MFHSGDERDVPSRVSRFIPMYKLHLILKYLLKRRIAWVSLVAVMLCTTMVVVVHSVMGGWLDMFKQSFHGLTGDIIIEGHTLSGFPHYQEIISRVEALAGGRGGGADDLYVWADQYRQPEKRWRAGAGVSDREDQPDT